MNLMTELISHIGGYVADQQNKEEEENTSVVANQSGKRSKQRKSNVSTNSSSSEGKQCLFDDPIIVVGIFDVVTILWVLHDAEMRLPENKPKYETFLSHVVHYAQNLISYYKVN